MKEEAPTKKLPPKIYGNNSNGGELSTSSTPTKSAPDEILSSLLRINNFDSISSIKDESLDIDLSACVTISPSGLINGNSLSSTDFWRVLDESAQNANELNVTPTITNLSSGSSNVSDNNHSNTEYAVTFLRPEPPNAFTNSPFKKSGSVTPVKQSTPIPTELQQTLSKVRLPASTTLRLRVFKEEPIEEPVCVEEPICLESKKEECDAALISSAFSIFQQPKQQLADKDCATTQQTQGDPCVEHSDEHASGVTLPEIKFIPTYKCLDCNGMVLNGQDDMIKHQIGGHRTRLFYKCGECDREFDLQTGLKKHLKTHRTEGRKDAWKKCPDCGKCLKLGSMWMHRKIHTDNKKYVCDICGQKFVQKINLTHHARIHSSEKPYECPECQKRFQERSHLQRHQKYHAQTRSYRCEKCGKMYKTERCLKVHNLVHLEQRPFACTVCDKSFISNSKLKQHTNIHTGNRPFKCNYCPRDFTNFPNWLKHTRRRHKVDHKTGEHLENIPSYCSKKSTSKSQKAAAAEKEKQKELAKANEQLTAETVENLAIKTTAAAATTTTTSVGAPQMAKTLNGNVTQPVKTTTPPVKATRKKKQPQQSNVVTNPVNTTLQPVQRLQSVQSQSHSSSAQLVNNTTVQLTNVAAVTKRTAPLVVNSITPQIAAPKQAKVKRERKQLAPKQLQKAPATVAPMLTQIKKEPLSESKTTATSNFLDLHGMSLTSAEELIMEQALEMEECGLYDTPAADIGTDNAISSESAAALHFQIKSEINDDKDDDYISLKKNERLACPSLESSPFSSPASIELTSVTPANATATTKSTNCYMQTFTLNAQGAMVVTGLTALNSNGTSNSNGHKISALLNSSSGTANTTSAAAGTNTTVVNLPLFVRPNQMLPSVDTLLFSTNTGTRYYANGKSTVTTAPTATVVQQNLTSS